MVNARLLEGSRAILRDALRDVKKPLLAFSGGKDAIVATVLAAELGVRDAVCEESFYFTMQRDDTRALVARLGLRCTFFNSLSVEWLAAHPRFIFSRDNSARAAYFAIRQQRTVAQYAAKGGYDAVIFGRRNDTNAVRATTYQKDGRLQIMPVRYWREPEVWRFIDAQGIPRPRIYSTVYGVNQHNGPWNIYNAKVDKVECFRDLATVERSVIEDAARVIPAARAALEAA